MSEPDRHQQEIPRESMTAEEIKAANLGSAPELNRQVALADYDPRWPEVFEREAAAIRARLSGPGRRIEHVGSTSVPDLPAKPVVDMLLIVPDSADETTYLPVLEGLGFELVIREPGWYEHRVLRKYGLGPSADAANVHVLSDGCPEVDRMLLFRDRLRSDATDRTLYAEAKRSLAQQTWKYLQNYADAKTEVIEHILTRAGRGA